MKKLSIWTGNVLMVGLVVMFMPGFAHAATAAPWEGEGYNSYALNQVGDLYFHCSAPTQYDGTVSGEAVNGPVYYDIGYNNANGDSTGFLPLVDLGNGLYEMPNVAQGGSLSFADGNTAYNIMCGDPIMVAHSSDDTDVGPTAGTAVWQGEGYNSYGLVQTGDAYFYCSAPTQYDGTVSGTPVDGPSYYDIGYADGDSTGFLPLVSMGGGLYEMPNIAQSGALSFADSGIVYNVMCGDSITLLTENPDPAAPALSGMMVDQGTLTPAFVADTFDYLDIVASDTASLGITLTGNENTSVITVNDTPVESGSATTVALESGVNKIDIVAAAAGGRTSAYAITVIRPGDDDPAHDIAPWDGEGYNSYALGETGDIYFYCSAPTQYDGTVSGTPVDGPSYYDIGYPDTNSTGFLPLIDLGNGLYEMPSVTQSGVLSFADSGIAYNIMCGDPIVIYDSGENNNRPAMAPSRVMSNAMPIGGAMTGTLEFANPSSTFMLNRMLVATTTPPSNIDRLRPMMPDRAL